MFSKPTAKVQVIWQSELVREFLAEFISTFVMMVSGRGVQGEQTLRKGSQGSGASERGASVRATHDRLPMSGPWVTLSLPQPLREIGKQGLVFLTKSFWERRGSQCVG